ncbi:MAG: hypothetical protein ABGY30_02695, partial [Acidimicrobiales bacterium]
MDEPTIGEDGPPDTPPPDDPGLADHDGPTSADTEVPRSTVRRLPEDLLPSAVTRRRFVLGVGFGAATIAFLRRLPTPTGTAGTAGPTTLPAVPRSSTVPPTPTTGVPDVQPSLDDSGVPPGDRVHDVVVAGGRVIDPETGFDAVAHVGIDG